MKKLHVFLGLVSVVLALGIGDWYSPLMAQALNGTRIHDIQGVEHVSPMAGAGVVAVPGVVTDVLSQGFYLQDPEPDDDLATSEGIYVYTRNRPRTMTGEEIAVGDAVLVSGRVSEYTAGQAGERDTNLSSTQILATQARDRIERTSRRHPLPAPVVLGQAGRLPPSQTIEDDGLTTFDPEADGIDFYESLEAMRVQVDDALVVNPAQTRGGVVVVGDRGSRATVLSSSNRLVIQTGDLNPERIYLQNTLGPNPADQVGDRFEGSVIGVLGYTAGHYQLWVTEPLPSAIATTPIPEVTTLDGQSNQLTIASFNVENLDPGDSDRFISLADIITTHLKSPDILALIEVQDNNGPNEQGSTAADQTYQRLIQAIQTGGGPVYDFTDIAPVANQDGGQPGGNIRVGFLYQPDRVELANRPKGQATEAVNVVQTPDGPTLSVNPGRIDPGNPAFVDGRKSLVAEFCFQGQPVFVIANHFKSKGGDDPLFGRRQPPIFATEVQRQQQAQVVQTFVQQLLAVDANANVVVLGDLNDFQFSSTLNTLVGEQLVNLTDLLPENDRYSFVFEGNAQQLDHILVSQHPLFEGNAEFDIVHVNAGFSDQVSDHDPIITRLTLAPLASSAREQR